MWTNQKTLYFPLSPFYLFKFHFHSWFQRIQAEESSDRKWLNSLEIKLLFEMNMLKCFTAYVHLDIGIEIISIWMHLFCSILEYKPYIYLVVLIHLISYACRLSIAVILVWTPVWDKCVVQIDWWEFQVNGH